MKKNYLKLLLIVISLQLFSPSLYSMIPTLEQVAQEDSGWSALRYILENKRLIKPLTLHLSAILAAGAIKGIYDATFGTIVQGYAQVKFKEWYTSEPLEAKCYLPTGDVTIGLPSIYNLANTLNPESLARKKMIYRNYRMKNKALLYGPPGVGKTTSAEDLAKILGAYYYPLKGTDFNGIKWMGDGRKRGRNIMSKIRQYAQMAMKEGKYLVVCIDEFDSVGDREKTDHQETIRDINQMLKDLDRLPDNVIVVAATNYKDAIDQAILSRFSEKIGLNYPDGKERFEILNKLIEENARINFNDKSCLERVAKYTKGFPGREIEFLLEEATNWVDRDNKSGIGIEHFNMALLSKIPERILHFENELNKTHQALRIAQHARKKKEIELTQRSLIKIIKKLKKGLADVRSDLQKVRPDFPLPKFKKDLKKKSRKGKERVDVRRNASTDDEGTQDLPVPGSVSVVDPERSQSNAQEDTNSAGSGSSAPEDSMTGVAQDAENLAGDGDEPTVGTSGSSTSGSSTLIKKLEQPRFKIELDDNQKMAIDYIRRYKYNSIAQALDEDEQNYNDNQLKLMNLSLNKTNQVTEIDKQVEELEKHRLKKENDLLLNKILTTAELSEALGQHRSREVNANVYNEALEAFTNEGLNGLNNYLDNLTDYRGNKFIIKSQILMDHSLESNQANSYLSDIILGPKKGIMFKKSKYEKFKFTTPSFVNYKSAAAIGLAGGAFYMWRNNINPIHLLPESNSGGSFI